MALPPPYLNLVIQETQEDSFLASATVRQYARVQLMSDGSVREAANIADNSIGVAKTPIANQAVGVVRLHLPAQYGLANANINVADPVAVATNGLVTPTLANTTSLVGVAKTSTLAGSNVPLVYYAVRTGVASA